MIEIDPTINPETSSNDLLAELHYLIQRYLSLGPCRRSAEVGDNYTDNLEKKFQLLRLEIEQHSLLPRRWGFSGRCHRRSFAEYGRLLNNFIAADHLPNICVRINSLQNASLPPSVPNLPLSLVGIGRQSLLRTNESIAGSRRPFLEKTVRFRGAPIHTDRPNHAVSVYFARQLCGPVSNRTLLSKESQSRLDLHCRVLGHLSSVFCVAFDRTGQFVFTGADDNLIKLWVVSTGLLRFTFRGHNAEIADMSVSFDNNFLASGSIDNVWCLQTGSSVAVFRNHSAVVTMLNFLPYYAQKEDRYLVSTGGDCAICFFKWNSITRQFCDSPRKFCERVSAGARIVSFSHSPGGTLIVTGCTDHYLRFYRLTDLGVFKSVEIEAHTDRVDSLVWAHQGLRFVSGSKDGCAKVWNFYRNDWHSTLLLVDADSIRRIEHDKDGNKYKLTMLCWSLLDDFIITAGSDHVLRVWDSHSGRQLRTLQSHKDEVFVLDCHPMYPELVLSAGHDGLLQLWDVLSGVCVFKYHNLITGSGHGAYFDACFSPSDGSIVAAVDSHGHLSLFGVGSNQWTKTVPAEQFFHTDYRPLLMDGSGYVLDEQTQLAPNFMPPPVFVNADGQPHPVHLQRLVPGKECCSEPTVVRRTDETQVVDVDADSSANIAASLGLSTPVDLDSCPLVCAWIRRYIVRPLDLDSLNSTTERLKQLGDDESERFLHECGRTPLAKPSDSVTVLPTESDSCRRPNRRRKAATSMRSSGTERVEIDRHVQSEHESSSDSEFNSSTSAGEEDEDSDSDYAGSEPRTRRTRRTRRMRNREQIEHIRSSSSSNNNNNNNNSSSNAEMSDDNQALTVVQKTPKKPRKTVPQCLRCFPDWMAMEVPRKFPYFPQPGDSVVYFRQGHDSYLDFVERNRLYSVSSKCRPRPELDAEETVLVDEVRFVRHPHRLICLKLAQMDHRGQRTGLVFNVRYHDLDGVPDFLVLSHLYDQSMRRHWKTGDRIQTVLDQQWWTGTIQRRRPIDDQFPRSNWLALEVRWDTGEDETLSPWDVEPAIGGRRTGGRENEASNEELTNQAFYSIKTGEWPLEHDRDGECSRLSEALQVLSNLDGMQPFIEAVDLDEYPEYSVDIDYPIDMATIRRRLENHFYRRIRAVVFDVYFLEINASRFNQPDSDIVRNARILVETLLRFIDHPDWTDILLVHETVHQLTDEELDRCRRRRKVQDQVGTKVGRVLPGTPWMRECMEAMEAVMNHQVAGHFINRDNPELSSVFDSALDLTTICEHLTVGDYSSPQIFSDTVLNLLQNCRSMADNKRSPIFRDALRLEGLFTEKMSGVVAKWQRLNNGHTVTDEKINRRSLRPSKQAFHEYNTRSNAPDVVRPRPQLRPSVAFDQETSIRVRKKPPKRANSPRPSASSGLTNGLLHSDDNGDDVQVNGTNGPGSASGSHSECQEKNDEQDEHFILQDTKSPSGRRLQSRRRPRLFDSSDDNRVPKRSRIPRRSSKTNSLHGKLTRSSKRSVNYNEISSDDQPTTSVSSRGRLRKTKHPHY